MDELGYIISDTGKRKSSSDTDQPTSPEFKKQSFIGLTPLKDLSLLTSPSKRPFRVSIEGNIGAGKSTLIKYFSGMTSIETYPEPIAWWRDLDGHNLLELLYKDINKWHNVFQTYVQLTRLKVQMSKPAVDTRVQMFERSIQNNRYCFVEQAHVNGYMHKADYAVLDQWYRWIREHVDISLDLIVYLRSSPQIVYERTLCRGRPEETGITLEYLTQLHESHEQWLMSNDERFNTIPVLVLDADQTANEIEELYKKNERKILGFDRSEKSKIEPGKAKRTLLL